MKKALTYGLAIILMFAFAAITQAQDKNVWIDKDVDCTAMFEFKSDGNHRAGQNMRAFHSNDCDMVGMRGKRGSHGKRGSQGRRGNHRMNLLAHAEMLELTDDQTKKIKDLTMNHKLAMIDQQAEVKKAGIKLNALRHDEDASERNVFSAIDKAASLKADAQKQRYSHRKAMLSVLTAEQADKLKSFRKPGKNMMFFGDGAKNEHKVIMKKKSLHGGGHGGR